MSINEFCDRHKTCDEGREWAMVNCRDMDHAWQTLRPDWLIWVATRSGVLDDRTLRLFAVWCARQVQHLLTDPRSLDVLDVAERHANGQATDQELRAAAQPACHAAWAAATQYAAPGAATQPTWHADDAWAAAWAATWAAEAAAEAAARAAVWAARAAARAAAADAAEAAARARQAEWLRANARPNWETKP